MSDAELIKTDVARVALKVESITERLQDTTTQVEDLKNILMEFQQETAKTLYGQLDILTTTAERLDHLCRDLLGDESHKGRCVEHMEIIHSLQKQAETQKMKEVAREAQLKLLKVILGVFSLPWVLEAFKFTITYILKTPNKPA